MRNKLFFAGVALLGTLLCSIGNTLAQGDDWSQQTACPGWNNPSNFSTSSSLYYYQGQTGNRQTGAPNVLTGNTQITWSSSVYSGAQMTPSSSNPSAGVGSVGCSGSSNGQIPFHDRQFAIMSTSSQAPGHPVNKDPNTGDHMPFVPTQFNTYDTTGLTINTSLTKSIRIGDDCSGSSTPGATGLFYHMYVTPANAMLYIYYSIVVETPSHHDDTENSLFAIRVMKQNSSNAWTQISDTLAYYVTATLQSRGGTVVIEPNTNINGWHSFGSINYKDWVKVSINLSRYLYQNVRIEVMACDCSYNAHFGYAYVCGECRPMEIRATGCPPGMSTDVATLAAPRGLLSYAWEASEWGVANPLTSITEDGGDNAHFTFRRVSGVDSTEASGAYLYNSQASDFRVTRRYGRNNQVVTIDSIGQRQTFRCKLKSALDPAKPFYSYLYVNVQNTKPSMAIDSLSLCDGNVKLWNRSQVPGDPSLVVGSNTRWSFYNNPQCMGIPLDTAVGDSTIYHFDDRSVKGVRVRTVTTDPGCYSEAVYPITPRQNPNVNLYITEHTLCDAAETTMIDSSEDSFYRRWAFRRADAAESDMTLDDVQEGWGDTYRTVTRGFSHAVEPVELTVRNGLYYPNPVNTADTIWCQTTVYDTVAVFVHPELEVTGDTVVCQGSSTDATVRALGVDGCTYEWSLTPNEVTGNLPTGAHLAVVPYADTATYYVKVTSPQGCVAWDSIHAYMVRPEVYMIPADGRICPGDTAVLYGAAADHYSWTASPSDPTLASQASNDTIWVRPRVTTTYTMVGHGTNDCNATPLTKQVKVSPLPVPRVKVDPGFVDTDDPVVTMQDVSSYGVSSEWLFADGSTEMGRSVTHRFDEALSVDSVHVLLTSYNELGCPIEYPFAIPVNLFTGWFPNAFTPDSRDGNNYFSLHTVNDYQFFHIYIYDRRGQLVFESEDVHFRWDGTCKQGPCPQGSYVYVCRYLKPGTTTLASKHGTITLIR